VKNNCKRDVHKNLIFIYFNKLLNIFFSYLRKNQRHMYDKRAVSGAAEHVFADTTETRFQIQLRKKKSVIFSHDIRHM